MKNFRSALKRLFTPAAVLLLVIAMAVASPVASMIGAVRVSLAAAGDSGLLTLTNLPARYAKVGEGWSNTPMMGSTPAQLWHAGKPISATSYDEVGQYEWRFYNGDVLFDTYTVTVTADKYAIELPDVMPTVVPRDIGKLELDVPAKFTKDGKKIKLGADYGFAVRANFNNSKIDASKIDTTTKTDKVIIDLTGTSAGTLRVTYFLQDKKNSNKTLAAISLNDIEVKSVTKSEVKFASQPAAPSVSGLSYCVPVKLDSPVLDSAKVGTNSFSVEGWTRISGVKFWGKATQPNNWDDVRTVAVEAGEEKSTNNFVVDKDGMTVTAKSLGWYKFEFTTTTTFGYTVEDSDKGGVYWSDAKHVNKDDQNPSFKWVDKGYATDAATIQAMTDAYNEEDFADTYAKDFSTDIANYIPMTSAPDNTDTKKITINPSAGITLPAIFPYDNGTAFDDLDITVTVAQSKTAGNNKVYDNTVSVTGYDCTKPLSIVFDTGSAASATATGNNVTMKRSDGLYQVTIRVQEKSPKYPDDPNAEDAGWRLSNTNSYYYFYVDSTYNMTTADNSPLIDEANAFQVSDVYLWEGKTFEFKVPTYTDAHTPVSKLAVDYYLVGIKGSDNEIIKINPENLVAGRMTVDFDDVDGKGKHFDYGKYASGNVYISAVARNFNALQNDYLKNALSGTPSTGVFDQDKLVDSSNQILASERKDGYAVKSVEFKIHEKTPTATIASADKLKIELDGASFKADQPVRIKEISATWDKAAVDARLSVAVYKINADKSLTPVTVYDRNPEDAKKQVVSAIVFNKQTYTGSATAGAGEGTYSDKLNKITDWYFMPEQGSGEYEIVVTAKENAANRAYVHVKTIEVDPSGNITVAPASVDVAPMGVNNNTIHATVALGSSAILPNYVLSNETKALYFAKNRVLYDYENQSKVLGDYTITVKGVNDPYCLIGNKFVPSQVGTYVFEYNFYLTKDQVAKATTFKPIQTQIYRVEVTNESTGTDSIQISANYGDEEKVTVLKADGTVLIPAQFDTIHAQTTSTATATTPQYAITLPQFRMSNFGASTNFTIDRETLKDYLELNTDKKYMYPAIAIPTPNIITDSTSSSDVEITVQKSGSTDYLVSSKKKNIGNNQDSLIEKIGGYFVFRPTGLFNSNGDNYMQDADGEVNGVYVVTYSTKTSSLSFNITVGDTLNGELKFNSGFLTYNNGKTIDEDHTNPVIEKENSGDNKGKRLVTINLKHLEFDGNPEMIKLMQLGPNPTSPDTDDVKRLTVEYLIKNAKIYVYYENNELVNHYKWSDVDLTPDEDYLLTFALEGSGTYKVTVQLTNEYTKTPVSKSFEFTIDANATNKNTDLSKVWGIILIILSVGLLGGVAFYFIKTFRETRFLDAPRKPKAPKAAKDKKGAKQLNGTEAAKKDAE